MDVLCIGNMCYDIILYLDSFPEENHKQEISDLLESGGGPSSNAAYLLSRWGVHCAAAGRIGRDAYGEKIIEEFQAAGTDVTLVDRSGESPTSLSVILTNRQTGSRTIVNRKTSKAPLKLNDQALRAVNPHILLFDGHEPAASLQAMEAFPEAVTILDAGSLREGTEILSRKVDYLVCSENFARSVSGLPDLTPEENRQTCIDRLRDLNGSNIVVTLGEKGLLYAFGDSFRHMPAFPAKAVDTTAAGDIFHGAFAYAVLHRYVLEDALRLSSMAAALSVENRGGRHSIPSLESVFNALGRVPPAPNAISG